MKRYYERDGIRLQPLPPASEICCGGTRDGRMCMNLTTHPSGRCHLHRDQPPKRRYPTLNADQQTAPAPRFGPKGSGSLAGVEG